MTTPSSDRAGLRSDVQALRAAAVGAVVLFHVWPAALPGGYVGVDIFFVISGYLITAHLLSEIERSGSVRLLAFWGRRLRRLLPAALTVLAASAVAVFLVLPQGVWDIHLREIIASALYGENWLLAADSVDYLAAENSPSVAQHYWSLAVEEQFYLCWPLLLLGALAVLPRRLVRRRKVAIALAVVFVVSLAASIVVTAASPGPAYFVTYARAWEFAAGGLLAALMTRALAPTGAAAGAARAAGWAMILAAVLLFTGRTPFPGWTALLPVVGAVLVIAGGDAPQGRIYRRITDLPPIQSIGTLSYGIYLWHWPVVVIGKHTDPRLTGVVVLALTWALAWLTYRFIENPVRFHPRLTKSIPLTYVSAAGACLVVVAVGLGGMRIVDAAVADSNAKADRLLARGAACLGARAVLGERQPCENPRLDGVLIPSPTARLDDTDGAYACYTDAQTIEVPVEPCHFGSDEPGAQRVALVGDSHAATLIPGLRRQAKRAGWSLDTYVGRGCRWLVSTSEADRCRADLASMKPLVAGTPYDLVIVANRREDRPPRGDDDPTSAAMAEAWRAAIARGTTVVAVADNPWLPEATAACVDDAEGLDDLERCTFTPDQAWGTNDPLPRAVELAGPGAALADLTRAYCMGGTCPVVIGHVLAYRDAHHLTATFVRTLAPFLVRAVEEAEQRAEAARAG